MSKLNYDYQAPESLRACSDPQCEGGYMKKSQIASLCLGLAVLVMLTVVIMSCSKYQKQKKLNDINTGNIE
jgi:hypothetical protein